MMITDSNIYFVDGCGRCDRFATETCAARVWHVGLATLRQIALATGLQETAKWGHPCYVHNGRNIAIIGAFRTNFRLSFFNAALLKDPQGLLEKQGPNAQTPGMISFTENAAVAPIADNIHAYLKEAIGYADAGIKAPKVQHDLDWPEELVSALDADPALADAFHALTPGRQKSYLLNLNGAKKSETRVARLVKFRDKIIAGKGALDR